MTHENKFFYEFFDGQIRDKESVKFTRYKIVLFALFSIVGFYQVIAKNCSLISLLVLEFGLLWNVYVRFNSKISNVFSVIVAFLYFYVACRFSLFANCLIYIACYIPFQQIATSKDYSEGNYIQIKKFITEENKLLFFIFFAVMSSALVLFDFSVGANFALIDGFSASLLVCSALLRNERYSEYYAVRLLALGVSLALWIVTALEFGLFHTFNIILMYFSYFVFDLSSLVYDYKTYKNQMTIQVEKAKKMQKEKLIEEKIEKYKKLEETK